MRRLLAADLGALANAARKSETRRAALGAVVGLGFLALASAIAVGRHLGSMPIRAAAGEAPQVVVPVILSALVYIFGFLVFLFVGADVRQMLFAHPTADLLMSAPLARRSIIVRAVARGAFTAATAYLVLLAPVLVRIESVRIITPATAVGTCGVVLLICPLLSAAAVLVSVVKRRLAWSRRTRVLMNLVTVIVSIVLILLFMAGFFSDRRDVEALSALLEVEIDVEAVWWAPGRWAAAASGLVSLRPVEVTAGLVAFIAIIVACVATATRLLPAAFEGARVETSPGRLFGRRGRNWPRGVVAGLAWKDLLAVLQQRSSIAGFAVFGVIGAMILGSGAATGMRVRAEGVEPEVNRLLTLGTAWTIAQLMVVTMQGCVMFADELRLRALMAAAPIRPSSLIAAKVPELLIAHVWLIVVFVATAPAQIGAGWREVLLFVPLAATLTAVLLAVALGICTLPILNRDPDAAAGSQVGKALMAGLVVMLPGVGHMLWLDRLRDRLEIHYTLGSGLDAGGALSAEAGALGAAALVIIPLGFYMALRNTRVLFRAQD